MAQLPLSLQLMVATCTSRLKDVYELIDHGLKSLRQSHETQRQILARVMVDVKDQEQRLSHCASEISEEYFRLGEDATGKVYGLLRDVMRLIQETLPSQCRLGLRLVRPKYKQKLDSSLDQLGKSVAQLHSSVTFLAQQSKKEGHRSLTDGMSSAEISVSSGQTPNSSPSFLEDLRNVSDRNEVDAQSSILRILWGHLPHWTAIEGLVGNAEDPGDGFIYDQQYINKTYSILTNLGRAWEAVKPSGAPEPPCCLQKMSRICLVLRGIGQFQLLLDFVKSGCTDDSMPFDEQQLLGILEGPNVRFLSVLLSEQYRAKPREWPIGSNVTFREEEPMPLVLDREISVTGSFGSISRVKDLVTGVLYVRKVQRTGPDERFAKESLRHVQHEIKVLKHLHHRHIIELVKTYQRGSALGLIIKPAATTDLMGLLKRYKRDKFDAQYACRDSIWLRPVMLTAFGCLSRGLDYLHCSLVRHKDIKPSNILYEKAMASNGHAARFLLADFGIAHDFSEHEDSKTPGENLYSPRYAPPELWAVSREHRISRSHSASKLEDTTNVMSDVDDSFLYQPAGRSADVFSLGCVFLEILSHITKSDLPLATDAEGRTSYARNINFAALRVGASIRKGLTANILRKLLLLPDSSHRISFKGIRVGSAVSHRLFGLGLEPKEIKGLGYWVLYARYALLGIENLDGLQWL
ncbi:uncharacterized protein KY384_000486 [Bacidia gigantensis]|uniref:uncharacterized protein n=1 Tax=Bacidia gigantensis TaxID=2732470 RepID=UPI001D053383|nr:uncharacterized protein KY384_000486 [Bacidia gigantensis]KAG8525726.1 hypothetical protein KY384_000486 [Bacidia gigantensis]